MRSTTAILLGLALSCAAYGANGVPSREVLAEMGLGGVQILSDDEAASVRGMGFSGLDGFSMFHAAFVDFQKQVKDFKEDVKKFEHKVDKKVDCKRHDMKPPKCDMKPPKCDVKTPKMPHGGGGKPW